MPRLVSYIDPNDRPEEGIIRAVARVGSLDTVVAGDPTWVPQINLALGPKHKLPPKSQIPSGSLAKKYRKTNIEIPKLRPRAPGDTIIYSSA